MYRRFTSEPLTSAISVCACAISFMERRCVVTIATQPYAFKTNVYGTSCTNLWMQCSVSLPPSYWIACYIIAIKPFGHLFTNIVVAIVE